GGVEVEAALRPESGSADGLGQHPAIVAAAVTQMHVERSVQPLMRGNQAHEAAAGPAERGDTAQRLLLILDVLQDVKHHHRVELSPGKRWRKLTGDICGVALEA